jgi:hypothetical protein
MKKKGFFGIEELSWWVIALIVLILMLFLYFIFNQKGQGLLDYFKNLWRYSG